MATFNIFKGLLGKEDISPGTGSFTRRKSDGTNQTLNKINLEAFATAPSTFTAADATPSVGANTVFKTANVVETTITSLDGGTTGQVVWVIINDAFTVVDFSSGNLKGNGGAQWRPLSGDHMQAVYDGTNWYCIVSANSGPAAIIGSTGK